MAEAATPEPFTFDPMDMTKTKKACLADKGTWAKDDAGMAPAASAAKP